MGENALQDAIAEAVGEVGTDRISNEPVVEDALDVSSFVKTPAEGNTDSLSKDAADKEVASSENLEVTEESVPNEVWGLDLTGIPAAKRAEVIAHIEGQNGYVHKLQEQLATATVPAPAAAEAEEVTDEAILEALGIDPEVTDPAIVRTLLTLGRTQLELESQLDTVQTTQQGQAAETVWNRELDGLEEKFGKMPGLKEGSAKESRAAQLRFALANNIDNPYELYFKLTGPVKQEAAAAAQAARRAAAQQDAGGNLRPSTSDAKTPSITKDMSLREATAIAMAEAEQETKTSWKRILGR